MLAFFLLPHPPWPDTGWSNRIEYEPGTGALAVFPSIHLETCDEPVASVQATVELETRHIGKGCDRDTYSEKSLHRLCGKEVCWLEPSVLRGGGFPRTSSLGLGSGMALLPCWLVFTQGRHLQALWSQPRVLLVSALKTP